MGCTAATQILGVVGMTTGPSTFVPGPAFRQEQLPFDSPFDDRAPTIGVILPGAAPLGTCRTLEEIASAAADEGYSVTLLPVKQPTASAVVHALRCLGSRFVDGVVILAEQRELGLSDFPASTGVPVVMVDANPQASCPTIDTDHVQGAATVTEYLLSLGHESVWHITGPMDSFAAAGRERGWRRTLLRFDRNVPPPVTGDWTAESGYKLGQVLSRDPRVTAVFAANDQMALGVLRSLHEAGRSVPGEVSVAGFDDIAEAASFWPPLTTVRQSFVELGRQVVRALLNEVSFGRRGGSSSFVPATLVVRSSTGQAPW